MSSIRYFEKYLTLFCFLFCANKPKVGTLGPRCDRCVPELFLHWTVLIKDFSVLLSLKDVKLL